MDLDEEAKRCRVMWEKGRNMYTAFFSALSDVQGALSPEDFDNWCFKSVGVSLNVALKASGVLREADRLRVESSLKRAAQEAREQAKLKKEQATLQAADIKDKRTETQLNIEKNLTLLHEQQAVNERLATNPKLNYKPENTEVAEILSELSARQGKTRIENGLDYIRLKELVKSGAEGKDPATGKKWKWEKWAVLAIGRPLSSIRDAMTQAKKALLKNDNSLSFSGKPLNGPDDSPVVDKVYLVQPSRQSR